MTVEFRHQHRTSPSGPALASQLAMVADVPTDEFGQTVFDQRRAGRRYEDNFVRDTTAVDLAKMRAAIAKRK